MAFHLLPVPMVRPALPRPMLRNATIACLLAALIVLAQWAAGGSRWLAPGGPPAAAAATARIKMPFPANQSWRVSQGYNTTPTEGGSHWNCDPNTLKDAPSQTSTCRAPYQYKYSLDLARTDGNTAGEQVLSPVDGTIRWIDEVAGGMSINLGDGYAVAFFHAILAPGLVEGQPVTQGQVLGTVAPAGVASNGGFPHIHFTVWQTTDGGNWSRNAVPFTGSNKADDFDFPALAESSRNQHRNVTIYSTNTGTATPVPAAPSPVSPATGTVIPGESAYVDFRFGTVPDATDYQVVVDGTTFSPWLTATDWKSVLLPAGSHRWQVRARNGDTIGPLSAEWVFTIQPVTTTTPTPTTTPAPPSATPTVTLSKTQGSAATVVTVGGTGFRAGEQVSIRWDGTTAPPLTTVAANSSGAFSTQVTIPDATRGAHTIYATGGTSGTRASAVYTLTASLSRTPFEGIPGTQVAVTARGFGANERVTVTWKTPTGPTLGTATTNASGTATLTITIPDSGFGWTDYTAVGATTGIRAYGAIQVLASTTVSPTSTSPGQRVTVSGRGFPAGKGVTAAWNKTSINVGSQLCAGTVSATGTYSCAFTVPTENAGTYPVTLTSADGTARSANVTVVGPTALSVSPASGAVGTNITATAGGFAANEAVSFTWDGAAWQTVNADSGGSVTVRATVPQLAPGTRTLLATGTTSGRSASASFTVNVIASAGTTSMIAPGTYVVTATREGLVGGTTSNGHVIVPDDHFASLPGCLASNCPWLRSGVRDAKWGTRTECGTDCYVLVVNPTNNRCQVAEVWDVGPWFRVDDWWNTTSKRHLNTLSTTKNILAQGYTGADAARNGLDVGFGIGPNGIGSSEKYLEVGNRAAIDLGDGTWTDLGLDFQRGIASGIRVSLLWQTGQDPLAAMNSCNRGVIPSPNLSLSASSGTVGTSVTVSGAGFNAGERVNLFWDATSGTPLLSLTATSSGAISASVRIPAATSGRHTFTAIGATSGTRASGTFDVTASLSRTPTGGLPGTSIQVSVAGFGASEDVKLTWNSPSGLLLGIVRTDARGTGTIGITVPNDTVGWHDYTGFGYTSRLRAYGAINVLGETVIHPAGTANPTLSGTKLAVVRSSGSPGGTSPSLVHDGFIGWSWDLTGSPPPTSGFVTLDLGASHPISGIRWVFRVSGGADAMTVATSNDNASWRTIGTFGNAPAKVWYGTSAGGTARYVRFTFANPNNDAKFGYLAEAEVWGSTTTVTTYPPGTANPALGGQKLSVVASSGSSIANSPSSVHDGNASTAWQTSATAPPNAAFTLDLGGSRAMSGVRWRFSATGGASEMLVQTSIDGQSWRTVGRYGNAPANTWYGQAAVRDARFVRFTFYNRYGDPVLGYVAEVEVWGTSTVAAARVAGTPSTGSATPTASPTPTAATSPTPSPSVTPTEPATPTVEPTSTPTPTTAATETPQPAATDMPTETPALEPTTEPTLPLPQVLVTGTISGTGGDGAVCRDEPSTDGARLTMLPEGSTVGITGNAVDDFYPVVCADQAGYVYFQFVRLPGQEPAPAVTAPSPQAPPTPELSRREVTIPVSGDTSVTAARPDAPQPSAERTALPAGGPSGAVAVLTFEVGGVAAGTVVDAKLVLPGAGDASPGGTLAVLPNTWVDADLASYTPVMDAGPAAVTDVGTIVAGESTVVDVTGVVTSDGFVTFLVLGTPDQIAVLGSSESGSPATLVLTVEEATLPD